MTARIYLCLLCFALLGLVSCETGSTTQMPALENGMFKVAILYPNGENATFDMDYYEQKHMPMVAALLGENLRFYEIDRGVSGRTPSDPAPFVAVGYFYVRDAAEYAKAIGQNREAVISDFQNYTNIQPVVQISEVKHIAYTSGSQE